MDNHKPFIDAIQADLNDNATRLVYADWLEERGDPRAEYLRVECELAMGPEEAWRRSLLLLRLREVSGRIDRGWVLSISRMLDVILHVVGPDRRWQILPLVQAIAGLTFEEVHHFLVALPQAPGILMQVVTLRRARMIERRMKKSGCRVSIEPSAHEMARPIKQSGAFS